jgi:hypothetical protein
MVRPIQMKIADLLHALLKKTQQWRDAEQPIPTSPSRRERDFVALALGMTVEFVARSWK